MSSVCYKNVGTLLNVVCSKQRHSALWKRKSRSDLMNKPAQQQKAEREEGDHEHEEEEEEQEEEQSSDEAESSEEDEESDVNILITFTAVNEIIHNNSMPCVCVSLTGVCWLSVW